MRFIRKVKPENDSNYQPPKRILCLVAHYIGPGEFQGGSTKSDRADRATIVLRTLESLRRLPYDTTVKVCGRSKNAAIPVDHEVASDLNSQLIVYATIEEAMKNAPGYDYVMVVEDDVDVPAETVERMMRFNEVSQVNEVLIPNRLEAFGTTEVCIDLLAQPGWLGLRRKFEGSALDVATNSHSGFAMLSQQQWKYAKTRVNFGRRDRIRGGLMASAFANLHLPFLLWRTRDTSAHHVVHSDHTHSLIPPVRVLAYGKRAEPESARGSIDFLTFDRGWCTVNGWMIGPSGEPAESFDLKISGTPIHRFELVRSQRLDVHSLFPDSSGASGFAISFDLLGIDRASDGDESALTISSGPDRLTATWPVAEAAYSAANAPAVPGSPHMPEAAIERLQDLLSHCETYLEYGTGGSTVLANQLGVRDVYCVESDRAWLAAVERRVSEFPNSQTQVHPIHADIGPTGEWGRPLGIPPGTSATDYALQPWTVLGQDQKQPQLILIDGRYRAACFLASLLHSEPGTTILFDDYLDRPGYSTVSEVAQPTALHQRVAEFVVPESLDRELTWRLLARHAGDFS